MKLKTIGLCSKIMGFERKIIGIYQIIRMVLSKMPKEEITKKKLEVVSISSTPDEITDGYHTFKELYDIRLAYNVALFNEWHKTGKYNVIKSKLHSDGTMFDDYFIVVSTLLSGQISNHYHIKYWDLFKCEEIEFAPEFDGHTTSDVIKRIMNPDLI